jgi:hypothetical protein
MEVNQFLLAGNPIEHHNDIDIALEEVAKVDEYL